MAISAFIEKSRFKLKEQRLLKEQRFMQITGERGMVDDEFINPNLRDQINSTPVLAPVSKAVDTTGGGVINLNAVINNVVKVEGLSEISQEAGRLAEYAVASAVIDATQVPTSSGFPGVS